MKRLLPFITIFITVNFTFSQKTKCAFNVDSNEVVRIAKKHKIYWTELWYYPPRMKLDTLSCTWTLITKKIDHTNKGDCKYTNGCTIAITSTLVVEAETRKIIVLEKKKKLYHNYE